MVMRIKVVSLLSLTLMINMFGKTVSPTPLKAETSEEIVLECFKSDIEKKERELELKLYWDNKIKEQKERELYEIEVRKNVELHYNPYNLLEPSGLTREKAEVVLEGYSLQTLAHAYVWMEEKYGVNALFLMALNREESANGRSTLAITNNNLGGVKSTNGGFRYYNNWEESLEDITRLIKEEYLSEDGDYFNGYSIWDVNTLYCEQDTWASNLNSIAYEMKVR